MRRLSLAKSSAIAGVGTRKGYLLGNRSGHRRFHMGFLRGNKLETDWKQIGNGLETNWKRIGNKLETDWKQIGNKLETDWKQIGNGLETNWVTD